TDAHRHYDIEEWRLNFHNAGAHLIDEIEKHLVLSESAQRRHQKLRIEGDGELAPFVRDRERFFGLANLWRVRSNVEIVLAEVQLHRVRLVAGQKRNAP